MFCVTSHRTCMDRVKKYKVKLIINSIMDNEQIEVNAFHSENKLKANVLTVSHSSFDCAEHVSFCVEMRVSSWDAHTLAIAFSKFFLVDMSGYSNKRLRKNEAWFSLQKVVLLSYECYRKSEVCLKYE